MTKKTYTATSKTLAPRPRSKRLREVGGTTVQQTGGSSSTGEQLWTRVIQTLEGGDVDEHIEAQFPAQVVKSLTLVDENGTKVTLSLVDGHLYLDGSLVAKEDVVAYGMQESDVQTVKEYVESQIVANPEGQYTAVARTLKIGNTIYQIEGTGGGGGGMEWGGTSGDGNTVVGMSYNSSTNLLSATLGTRASANGYINSGSLNSRTAIGTYGCDLTNVTDKPTDAYAWGTLIVTGLNNLALAQLYMTDNNSSLWMRHAWKQSDGSLRWRDWVRCAFASELTDKMLTDASNATTASVNTLINKLTTGSSAPEDTDYYISQYAGGVQQTYHRRPVSALYAYILSKIKSLGESDAKAVRNTILQSIPAAASDDYFGDSSIIICRYASPTVNNGGVYTRTSQQMWVYIKSKGGSTLAGWGITNAYTKAEANALLSDTINGLDYTDTEVANQFITLVTQEDGKIKTIRRRSLTASDVAKAGKLSNDISGNADTATDAAHLKHSHGNEVNIKSINASNYVREWFNYRNADTDSLDDENKITDYLFGNRNGSTDGVTLNAEAAKLKQIKLVSPDGTKTRILSVDNSGNFCVDGNIVATGDVVAYK